MISERILNWDADVTRWAIGERHKVFLWGLTDCGSLVRRAHAVMYGANLYAALGEWTSSIAAARVLVEHGGMGAILERRGGYRVRYAYLQTGDVILGEGSDRAASVAIAGHLLTVEEGGLVELLELPDAVLTEPVVYRLPWVVDA